MIEFILALVVPFLVMVIVTRIAFSLVGATIVTWMVSLFAFSFHEDALTAIAAIISFVGGFLLARKRLQQRPGM